MKETNSMYGYMKHISETYNRLGSLQKTADELGIAYAKVRKTLITLGDYDTGFSREVAIKRRSGKSILEIAEELNTTTNRVNAFLPYEKVIYDGPEQTSDSQKSKLYRNRIQVAKKNFITKEIETINNKHKEELKKGFTEKEKVMENKSKGQKTDLTAVHLHLELLNDNLTDYHKRMLRRYGESTTGESISRDILIPSDMMLHHLHYAIQRLFGWQNSHLRKFILTEEVYQKLTGGTVKGWSDLVGILFQPPGEMEEDIFWDDDYQSGSIKMWLKRKYIGPYFYCGAKEKLDAAKKDIQELMDYYSMVDVKESYHDYWERKKVDNNTKIKILRRAPLIELTLDEMYNSIIIDSGTDSLLERLKVNELLAAKDETIAENEVFPVIKELIYKYDFGDNWDVLITKIKDCNDLLASGVVSEKEIIEANDTVISKHIPVCIHRDGVFVLDDVGGLCGFADFLGKIYESEGKEEKAEYRSWAQNLGWSTRKVSNKIIL